jgi:AraC family L-rhamnose operon transcriptional activator RhaR
MTALIPPSRFTDLSQLPLAFRLGGFACEMLTWGYFEPVYWRNYLHVHSFFEICYAFAGRGTFQIGGEVRPVAAGDLFVAKPHEPHEIISSVDDPLGIYFWSHTLIPTAAGRATPLDTLLDEFALSRRWVQFCGDSVRRTLDGLTEEVVLRRPGYPQAIEALLVKLVLDTARAVTDVPIEEAKPEGADYNPIELLVQKMLRFLRDNYNRPILVRDVAAEVHLSERHTNRLFHQSTGLSIMQYLTKLRIETAAQLLLDPDRSIKEIAWATGYPDAHYFATLFRRYTGLTPSSYRRKRGTHFLNRA